MAESIRHQMLEAIHAKMKLRMTLQDKKPVDRAFLHKICVMANLKLKKEEEPEPTPVLTASMRRKSSRRAESKWKVKARTYKPMLKKKSEMVMPTIPEEENQSEATQ